MCVGGGGGVEGRQDKNVMCQGQFLNTTLLSGKANISAFTSMLQRSSKAVLHSAVHSNLTLIIIS